MKNFYSILLAIILCACSTPEIPQPVGGTADFYYNEISSLYVKFYNTSSAGLKAYYWDFGDGTSAGSEDPVHRYAKAGTYKVKLTCKDKYNYTYNVTKNVTVGGGSGGGTTNPTAVYVTGFRIDGIYMVNIMYRVELTGHNIYGQDEKLVRTDYTAIPLNKDNIPYVILLDTPVKIGDLPDPFDWYSSFQIDAYAAAKTTLEGANLLSVTIPANVLANKTEHTAVSPNGTRVTILFKYQ